MLEKVDSANLFESAEASNLHYLILSNPKIVKVLSDRSLIFFNEKMHFSIEYEKVFFIKEKCNTKTQYFLCNPENFFTRIM